MKITPIIESLPPERTEYCIETIIHNQKFWLSRYRDPGSVVAIDTPSKQRVVPIWPTKNIAEYCLSTYPEGNQYVAVEHPLSDLKRWLSADELDYYLLGIFLVEGFGDVMSSSQLLNLIAEQDGAG